MDIFIAFLRGINVGGHHTIKMNYLKQLHKIMGHGNIVTYLQSGNIIFESAEKNRRKLILDIEKEYEKKFGFHTNIFIRNITELSIIVNESPVSLTPEKEAKLLHVVQLSEVPEKALVKNLLKHGGLEEKHLKDNILYVYYPQGAGRSKFTLPYIEKTLKIKGTARNWNTITKILDLAKE